VIQGRLDAGVLASALADCDGEGYRGAEESQCQDQRQDGGLEALHPSPLHLAPQLRSWRYLFASSLSFPLNFVNLFCAYIL